jgi:hypothetical protein
MSIWINKSVAVIALAGLTACQDFDFAPQNKTLSVLGGSVNITAPNGYCVDTNVSTTAADTAVVLMGRCFATSNRAAALLTASLGAQGSDAALSPGPVALTRFFGSVDGRALLSSTGNADDVQIKSAQTQDETLFLLISDTETGDYWRAISGLQGRLLTLTAAGAGEVALESDDGRTLLAQALSALQKANAKPPAAKVE